MTEETAAGNTKLTKYLVVIAVMLAVFTGMYVWSSAATTEAAPETLVAAPVQGGGDECGCCESGSGETIEGVATVEGDVQRIYVDATSGFAPNKIVAAVGVPLEITFSEGYGCMAEVQFPDFGVYEDLTNGGAVIDLPALDAGEYTFSCGMEMVFGTLLVQ